MLNSILFATVDLSFTYTLCKVLDSGTVCFIIFVKLCRNGPSSFGRLCRLLERDHAAGLVGGWHHDYAQISQQSRCRFLYGMFGGHVTNVLFSIFSVSVVVVAVACERV